MKTNKKDLFGDPTTTKLSEIVEISRQFLRSVRIDTDLGREDALNGYVCQGTSKSVLENMANQINTSKQRAFTWTGPYGGGKSSLALLLCSLIGKNSHLRSKAKSLLQVNADNPIFKAFETSEDGWEVITMVGKRTSITEELSSEITKITGEKKKRNSTKVIKDLVSIAEKSPNGVLLVIDELGKFLESAAIEGDDIYFYQELAEAASRSTGKLIVIGILHQAFEAYAARLGRDARNDWAKIQGRYIDIPMISATDEVVELIGKAITLKSVLKRDVKQFTQIAKAVKARRPSTPKNLAEILEKCWPLHPIVAILLGPISRRPFSQNERSTFGFIASREPMGFIDFLESHQYDSGITYTPANYWDYLQTNMDSTILASTDGHRWALATEAIDRTFAKGKNIHFELVKTIALIELFRAGSGLMPETAVLEQCISETKQNIQNAIQELIDWKILIERKHINSYGIFAGSDFDIELAVLNARNEIGTPKLDVLTSLSDIQPIIAKRLYHETGSLRWFNRKIARYEELNTLLQTEKYDKGNVGTFLLVLPELGEDLNKTKSLIQKLSGNEIAKNAVIGTPTNAEQIAELSLEFLACSAVLKNQSELEGDAIARKEINNRLELIKAKLEDELTEAYSLTNWYWRGNQINTNQSETLSWIASEIAAKIFTKTPFIHNELVNRHEPSSNSKKARKDLMYRMIHHYTELNLGYKTYSADAGLYYSIIARLNVHQVIDKELYGFLKPTTLKVNNFIELWNETDDLIKTSKSETSLIDIYNFWSAAPFGIKNGLMPILALVYFLANRSTLAIYINNVFTPEITETSIDEWLLDPKQIRLKFVPLSIEKDNYLKAIVKSLVLDKSKKPRLEALAIAKKLVSLVIELPNLTKRTTSLTADAQALRSILLKANDPHKLLFADLPSTLKINDYEKTEGILKPLVVELRDSYDIILKKVEKTVFEALDENISGFENIRKRALVVKGIAGEFRLEAFVGRLETYDGTVSAVEGLISLATNKPPATWVDRDIDTALLQLTSWAYEFRKAETIAPLRGRPSTRRMLSVVFGGSDTKEVNATFDIDEKDNQNIKEIADSLLKELKLARPELALAALAEVGSILFKEKIGD
jgi:hypothetical protein